MQNTHEILLLMMIFVTLWFAYEFIKRQLHCRYCGFDWGKHDETCPWAGSGGRMQ